MKNIHTTKRFWQAIIVIVIDGLFFGLTDPNKVNSVFLIVGFVLLALSVYVLMQIILGFLIKLGFKIKNRGKIAISLAILAGVLLAFQSIGQLSTRDVLIIIPIAVLIYAYAAYIRPRTLI